MRSPVRIPTGEPAVDLAIGAVRESVLELLASPMADQLFLENVTLGNGTPTTVRHGLRRVPRGSLVTRLPVVGATGRIQTVSRSAEALVLQADGFGADVVVDLVVF